MTREESIITNYQRRHPDEHLENPVLLLEFEYNNYVEGCEFCGEQPLTFDEWAKQEVIPLAS